MIVPGQKISPLPLPGACHSSAASQVILFLPFPPPALVVEQLSRLQTRLPDLAAQGAQLVAVSSAGPAELARFAEERGFSFPILSDSSLLVSLARLFDVLDAQGQVIPAVFILDSGGVVRRAFEIDRYPNLPNPALIVRAVMNLMTEPRPAPITAQDWQLGSPEAPLVLIEYSDYECKSCMQLHTVLHELVSVYGSRVCLVHRHLPLRQTHPLAQLAAEAAEAAGAQGKFWEMHNRLFQACGRLKPAHLLEYAVELGLDLDQFRSDLENHRYETEIRSAFNQAISCKIKLPPTLFVNGSLFAGSPTWEALTRLIDRILSEQASGQTLTP